MKTILLTLLFFAVVLFVTVECRRSGAENGKKPKSGKGGIGKLRKQGKRHYNRFIFFGCVYGKQLSLLLLRDFDSL